MNLFLPLLILMILLLFPLDGIGISLGSDTSSVRKFFLAETGGDSPTVVLLKEK
jgi:hypothetical protein